MARLSFIFLIIACVAVMFAIYNTARMMASHSNRVADLDFDYISRVKGSFLKRASVSPEKKRLFHTAVTASSSAYGRWQCRIMYYWFKRFKDQAGSEMGGFTRILHSGVSDNLMDEIPTFVVDPLPDGLDKGYIVLHRPWAIVQWLQKATINEDYIFMAEPDHLITKPLPNLALKHLPAAFPFFYITPTKYEQVIRKFFHGPATSINPVGNSPVIIQKSHLQKIAPTWHNLSLQMKQDADADKAFGWVLEMYAYAIASAVHGVQHVLYEEFMIQPPWDKSLGEKFLLHYTYGCDYTLEGVLTYGKTGQWRFDKRAYTTGAPPRNLTLPPPGVPESVVMLVQMINEATANIANWKEGE